MSKKPKGRTELKNNVNTEDKTDIAPEVETKFKIFLKIMSWTVGICFLIIITLPNFEFIYLDVIIKFVFYLGVFNLLLFILIEFFGENLKKYLSKKIT
jgi:hypothetical protein